MRKIPHESSTKNSYYLIYYYLTYSIIFLYPLVEDHNKVFHSRKIKIVRMVKGGDMNHRYAPISFCNVLD